MSDKTMSPKEFRTTMKRARVSQLEAARRLDCVPSTVWRWLRGPKEDGGRRIPTLAAREIRRWVG